MNLKLPGEVKMSFRALGWVGMLILCSCTSVDPSGSSNGRDSSDAGARGDGVASLEAIRSTCTTWVAGQRATAIRELQPPNNQHHRDDMLASGGGVRAIDNTYYAVWFPDSFWQASERHVVINLHGTHGAPEFEWTDWHEHFSRHGLGFVSLNYLIDEARASEDSGYLEPAAMYSLVKRIVDEMRAPCATDTAALTLMGWSRGSIYGMRMMALDRADGKLFRAHLANSAAWGFSDATLPSELKALQTAGNTTGLLGANFWMYCGTADKDSGSATNRCDDMAHAQQWLTNYGAHVEKLYRNTAPDADHHSMVRTTEAVDQALTYLKSL